MTRKIFKRCGCSRLVPVEIEDGWTFAFGKCPGCGAVVEWRAEAESQPEAEPAPGAAESATGDAADATETLAAGW